MPKLSQIHKSVGSVRTTLVPCLKSSDLLFLVDKSEVQKLGYVGLEVCRMNESIGGKA